MTIPLAAQAPGGISVGLEVWLKANVGTSTTTLGAGIATWTDQSGNINDATGVTNQPAYNEFLNYNPMIEFESANSEAFVIANTSGLNQATSKSNQSVIVAFKTSDDVTSRQVLYEQGGGSRGLNIYIDSGQLYFGGWNLLADGAGSPWGYSSSLGVMEENTAYIATLVYDGNSSSTGTIEGFINGVSQGQAAGVGLLYSHSGGIGVGEQNGGSYYVDGAGTGDINFFNGQLGELIIYNQPLSAIDRRAIETYLGIKWGVGLPAAAHDFYGYTAYETSTAGIGAVTSNALSQSQSQNQTDGLVHISNPSSLGDGDYLVWGNDGGSTNSVNTEIPGSVSNRMERIWRVQETNNVGTVDLTIDISTLDFGSSLVSDFYLLVDPIDADFSDVSPIAADSYSSGIVSFLGLNLNDGDFFCLTLPDIPGPGGQGGNLNVWLRADAGTSTTTPGAGISTWSDQSGNGLHATTSGTGPSYEEFWDFNPYIDFTTANRFFELPNNSLLNIAPVRSTYSIVTVIRTGTNTSNRQVIYEQGGSSRGFNIYLQSGLLYFSGWNIPSDGAGSPWGFSSVNMSISSSSAYIIELIYEGKSDITGTIACYANGQLVGTIPNVGRLYSHSGSIGIGSMRGGGNFHTGGENGDNYYFRGEMSELLIYGSALSDSERQDLESYLSIKWGVTIPVSVQNYYAITYPGYDQDMAGIGQDIANQFIDQPAGKSINSGQILTISNPSSLTDGDFLVWANDGGDGGVSTTTGAHALTGERLERIWRIHETNDAGTVSVSFDVSSFDYLGRSASDFALLIDPINADFSDASTIIASSFDGSTVTITGVDFSSGDYYTLGVPSESLINGPGGLNDSLGVWLRADLGTSTTTEGAGIGLWTDQSDFGNDATGGGGANNPVYRSSSVNFNPSIEFDVIDQRFFELSDDSLLNLAPSRTEETVSVTFRTSDDVMTRAVLYEQGGGSRGLNVYIYQGELYFGAWNLVSDGAGSPWGASFASSPIDTGETHIATMIYEGNDAITGTISCYLDGELIGTISNVGRLYQHTGDNGIGGQRNDTYFESGASSGDGFYFGGEILEFVLFGDAISTTKRRNLESYLSIRHGVTIPVTEHDYYNSTYSAYGNDLAGIGLDNTVQVLNQQQSKSENDGALVTISNPSELDEGDFLVWGNNAEGFCNNSNVPLILISRMDRIWRVTETNDVGTVTVTVDLTGLINDIPANARLLVDTDDDFSDATIYTVASSVGEVVTFNNVNFGTGNYFTVGATTLFEYEASLGTVTWLGSTDSDWAKPDNWDFCGIPSATDHVIINSSSNPPVLDQDQIVSNLMIASSADLDLNGFELIITGDLDAQGGITANNGTITFQGISSQTIVSNSQLNLEHLNINNASGVTVTSGMLNIHGSLEILLGSLTTNSLVTLTSDAFGTGRIGEIGFGDIIGDVTIERFYSHTQRQWRYLATPFTDNEIDFWQNDFPVTGDFLGASTGVGLTSNPSIYWYDETQAGGAILADYVAFPLIDSSEVLVNGRGYATYVRNTSNVTMSNSGSIKVGSVDFGVTYTEAGTSDGYGWNLIGNPYPSEIDWTGAGWSRNLVGDAIYFLDNENGQSVSFVNGISNPPGQASGVIASGQAFWVRSSAGGTLTCTEEVKTAASHQFYRTETPSYLIVKIQDEQGREDQTMLYYDELATPDFDIGYDAERFFEPEKIGVSLKAGGVETVINGVSRNDVTQEIPLVISPKGAGQFIVSFHDVKQILSQGELFLFDYETGESFEIYDGMEYSFDLAGFSDGRLALRLQEDGVITEAFMIETKGVSSFSLYPNPSNSLQLMVDAVDTRDAHVTFFDVMGIEVASYQIHGGQQTITLPSDIQNGVYNYIIKSDISTNSGNLILQR